ncbi:Lipopolysaccharide N-acetylglucosaminyltransferase [Roseomonas mucosa]|uniref:tetratricopeptide repeat-containing glycosyltransferase family protein n=1 Tax=Roseomonas mucosa TaxID=207340 RepID=UPI0021FC55A3|nr:tetratricopeptide repeat-containing glycosyltransferase family protein [Roseomonas mucosa]QDJ07828.1 Lipopolysaccharide N-acetylglucosaminyltransferase [Roseomonas mucosa]
MSQAATLLEDADRARDAREWQAAALLYGDYLRLRPDDRAAIVQQGHMVKEAGDPEAALALYDRARRLDGADPDIHLQSGHALKLLRRMPEALDAYGRALALDPEGEDPWREWLALARRGRPLPRRLTGVGLDLSDLVSWVLGGRRVPSGIQRVQYEIAAGLCAGDGAVLACALPPAGVAGGWRELPTPLLLRLRRLAVQGGIGRGSGGADPREAAWQEAVGILHDWLAAAPDLAMAPGALLLCPGTAWAMPEQAARLAAAREAGARYVPLLHDTIPLSLPEWCEARTVADYAAWFSALPLLADGILCNSEATAAELRRCAARHLPGLALPPLAVVPLNGAPVPPAREAPLPPELESRPYVLCTGTIEGRKNHLLLFQAWLTLARRLGGACPLLVCVGRPGWRSEGAMALLAASPELAAKVMILPEVDDAVLHALTRHCRFAVSASHGEGWGLPVSEALALGRPVLAPGHSALLESGAAGATFFTPNSEPDLVEKALALIAAPEAAAARIAPGGGCRPWGEVAREMLARARSLVTGGAAPAVPPLLPPGLRVRLAPPPCRRPGLEQALAQVLPSGPGWLPAEAGGRPSLPGLARLRCRVRGGPLRLLLEVRAPAEEPCRLRIGAWREGGEEMAMTLDLAPGQAAETMLPLPDPEAAEEGVLEILLDSEAETRGAALVALGLARDTVLEDRLRLIEGRELLALLPD